VAAVVRWARVTGQRLAIRSGGHSIAGHSTGDGVVVLDVGGLNTVEIDPSPDAAWAWAGPGATAGEFTRAAYERGRAVSFGDTGSVGLGGLVVGGGIGWLVRRYGLTIDSLLAAELVTADGELVIASPDEHPDLFWALRGGGGNFGVVTRYQLALRPIGEVDHGTLLVPATRANVEQVLAFAMTAPEELTLMPYVMAIPPMDEVAAEWHATLGLWIEALWSGSPADGAPVLAELRTFGPSLMDSIERKPYPAVYPERSGDRRGGWTASSVFVDEVDDGLLTIIEAMLAAAPPGDSLAIFRPLGGAAARVANDATAFGWRDRSFLVWLIGDSGEADAATVAALRAWVAEFRRAFSERGVGAFVSFMGSDDEATVAASYPPATLARLREVKRRYDPDNLFRRNLNIAPADSPA
jgi:FAD/FMN-containing dehydrogenase